jgi:hypothetical protein
MGERRGTPLATSLSVPRQLPGQLVTSLLGTPLPLLCPKLATSKPREGCTRQGMLVLGV